MIIVKLKDELDLERTGYDRIKLRLALVSERF